MALISYEDYKINLIKMMLFSVTSIIQYAVSYVKRHTSKIFVILPILNALA